MCERGSVCELGWPRGTRSSASQLHCPHRLRGGKAGPLVCRQKQPSFLRKISPLLVAPETSSFRAPWARHRPSYSREQGWQPCWAGPSQQAASLPGAKAQSRPRPAAPVPYCVQADSSHCTCIMFRQALATVPSLRARGQACGGL